MSMTTKQKISSKIETEIQKLRALENRLYFLLQENTQPAIKQDIDSDFNALSLDQILRKWS